jgi:hypothetical protein
MFCDAYKYQTDVGLESCFVIDIKIETTDDIDFSIHVKFVSIQVDDYTI